MIIQALARGFWMNNLLHVCRTGEKIALPSTFLTRKWTSTGLRWYDTGQEHIVSNAVFRNCGVRIDDNDVVYNHYSDSPTQGCLADGSNTGCDDDSSVWVFNSHSDMQVPEIMQVRLNVLGSSFFLFFVWYPSLLTRASARFALFRRRQTSNTKTAAVVSSLIQMIPIVCRREYKIGWTLTALHRDWVSTPTWYLVSTPLLVGGMSTTEVSFHTSMLLCCQTDGNSTSQFSSLPSAVWDPQAPLWFIKKAEGPQRALAHVSMFWDQNLHARVSKLNNYCYRDADNCPIKGYLRHLGHRFTPDKSDPKTLGMPVTASADFVGFSGGYGWLLELDSGPPKNITFSRMEIDPDSVLMISIPYPKGTTFTITAQSDTCWEKDGYVCVETFQQTDSIEEVRRRGNKYHVNNEGVLT